MPAVLGLLAVLMGSGASLPGEARAADPASVRGDRITARTSLTVGRQVVGSLAADAAWFVVKLKGPAGVTISETGGSTDVDEAGPTSDSYTIVLDTEPTGNVTVFIDPDAQTDLGSGPGIAIPVIFKPGDWNVPQPVTVTAVDDQIDESSVHSSTITHTAASIDPAYNGIAIADVIVNVPDNDAAGVTVSESGGSTDVNEERTTSDAVTITVTPDAQVDLGAGQGAAVVLIFGAGTWNAAQSVTVTAVDDQIDEISVHSSTIRHAAASTDPDYDGITIASVIANVVDNDATPEREQTLLVANAGADIEALVGQAVILDGSAAASRGAARSFATPGTLTPAMGSARTPPAWW